MAASVGERPRRARLKQSVLVFGVASPVLVAIMGVVAWTLDNQALAMQRALIEHGRETSGVLLGRRTSDGYRRTRYLVRYGYIVEGRRYSREQDSRNLYDAFPRRPRVTVSYSTTDPALSVLGTRAALDELWQASLKQRWQVPTVAGSVCLLFAFLWRRWLRQLHLVRHGIVHWGTSAGSRRVGRVYRLTVLLDDGQGPRVRRFWVSAQVALRHRLHSRVAMLAEPDNPELMVPYESAASAIRIEEG